MSKHTLFFVVLIFSVVTLAASQTSLSKRKPVDVQYLKGMPSPSAVVEGLVGKTPIETYAMRVAALRHVQKVIRFHGMYRYLAPEEERMLSRYVAREKEEWSKLGKGKGKGIENEIAQHFQNYSLDTTYLNAVLARTVSPSTLQYYSKVQDEFHREAKRKAAEVQRTRDLEAAAMNEQFIVMALRYAVILVSVWILPSLLLGLWYRKKGRSFWLAFLVSFLLSPIIGLIMVVLSQHKEVVSQTPVGDHELIPIPVQNRPAIGPAGRYHLYSRTGKVVGTTKNMETRVHGSGGGGSYQGTGSVGISISSTTVVHDQIFLQDKNGEEHAIKLEGWDIACREGHVMTTLWATEKGQTWGRYIAIHNHTTSRTAFGDKALADVFRRAPGKMALRVASAFGIIGAGVGVLVTTSKSNVTTSLMLSQTLAFVIGGSALGSFLGLIFRSVDTRALWRFKGVLARSLERARSNL